jgi:transposase-like protein
MPFEKEVFMKELSEDLFERALRMVRANRYWSRREAAIVLARLESSGLTVAAFARQHGIPDKRLRRWKGKLSSPHALVVRETTAVVEPTLPFARVHVVGTSVESARANGSPSPLEVVVHSGRRIRVLQGFDGETLARVVTVLEALPC